MSDQYLSVTHTIHDVDTRTGRHGALHTRVNTRFDTLSICCRSAHAEPPAMSRTPLRASRGSGQHGLKFHELALSRSRTVHLRPPRQRRRK